MREREREREMAYFEYKERRQKRCLTKTESISLLIHCLAHILLKPKA